MTRANGPALTARDLLIVEHIANGLTNPQIAAVMNFAPGTVNKYVTTMLTERGLRNRAHLVGWAYRTGLLTVEVKTVGESHRG